jgi:hypothetical protein
MIAAMMTAANLGARVTGWGFVIFLIGALAWITVSLGTGQHDLLWSNALLAIVDVIGIWRWLGRRATLDDGAAVAARNARHSPAPLFSADLFGQVPFENSAGETIAHTVGAMVEGKSGRISYVVVREGNAAQGVRYAAVPWDWLHVDGDKIRLRDAAGSLSAFASIDPAIWPAACPDPI